MEIMRDCLVNLGEFTVYLPCMFYKTHLPYISSTLTTVHQTRRPTNGVVTGVPDGHTHADTDVTGGSVQCALAVHEVDGLGIGDCFSALTSTGITPPVSSEKRRCPRTRSREAISPEWLVMETNNPDF